MVQGTRSAAKTRYAGEPDGRGRHEAAGKDEDHARPDKEYQLKGQKPKMIKKIKAKGRMDANTGWWVSELLAADRQKVLFYPGWEDTVLPWYSWLYEITKKDEEKEDGGGTSKVGQSYDQKC